MSKLKTFRAVAERSHGIIGNNSGRQVNPFHIRDIFDPNLRIRVERRTWDAIPATSERAARKLFDAACADGEDMRGFKLVSLTEVVPAATTCGRCLYEESEGELIEQCSTCKAIDKARDGL